MKAQKNCTVCHRSLTQAATHIARKFFEKDSSVDDWPICLDCMIDHCIHANCLYCNYGEYPSCQFLKMKVHFREHHDQKIAGRL